jgi:hypothetical protein
MVTNMKQRSSLRIAGILSAALAVALSPSIIQAAPATLLFEDDFNRGIPGWVQVQPTGTYLDGPMRWQYDIVSEAFLEQSNIYTDGAASSPSATAVMLINDAVAGTNFTYTARLTAGDDDAFGLIFGYQNGNSFYRVSFSRQTRTAAGFPWNGWNVDRKVNNVATNLFGDGADGVADPDPSFRNIAGQPFDVTITVTNGLFSLTVLDDPENTSGAQFEYALVEAQPIEGIPANGRVGMFTWGQSGGTPRGFRIQNPTLAPVALVGNPNALTNWTPVVTTRADGSGLDPGGANGGIPIWSLALGQNGAFGTLHENSDALAGNDPEGQIDFPAASVVAGDVTWSNYVFTARIIPADDDGHGILFRYQDNQNFYRVALRAQSSATGVREGLSIQKVANGVWEEIYFDDPVRFDPPNNVPYDITAVIIGDRLQVLVVADPNGTAQRYNYGPFDLTGDTVPAGRIGLFSWAMARTEFDFVTVHGIEGVPLQVSSAFGSPDPAVGLHGFTGGSSVTASAPSPVVESPGVRRVVSGWSGIGSVPATGTGASVTFTLNEPSAITWTWAAELQLTATAGPGGQVEGPAPGTWLPQGTNVMLTAQPNAGFVFAGWTGGISSTEATLNLALTLPFTVEAKFEADTDADGLPDSWEQTYFNALSATAAADADSDGETNLEEYQRGTHPNHAEVQVADDGLADSRWINVQRDPGLPGQLVVRDFGGGFRGVWENSNDFREANTNPFLDPLQRVDNVSFEGPRIIIRTNVWQPGWNDFTGSAIFSVGDNDGNCVYFRYQDELNWYRVTVTEESEGSTLWRAKQGVSIQKRVDGVFSEIAHDLTTRTDATDTLYYKRVRVTVSAQGSDFEVRVIGWNVNIDPPDWDPSLEAIIPFADSDVPEGRFGVGTWGQSGGNTATASNPVAAGVLIEDVVITVGGQEVFREDWEELPLAAELPVGWTNPNTGAAAGTWQVSAHEAIIQTAGYAPLPTGTIFEPKADADAAILLAPAPGVANYFLELGFHPFDDDGIGFVYDFQDTNNYARVMFVSEATGNARIPQGISVSRKSGGTWSDLVAGDPSFIYTAGRPFSIEFANNNGQYRLRAWNLDEPAASRSLHWTGPAASEGNRFGLTAWGQQDAHYTYARAFSLPGSDGGPGELSISAIAISGGNVTLTIDKPEGTSYAVEQSPTLPAASWTSVAENQTGDAWTGPLPQGASHAFWRLRMNP